MKRPLLSPKSDLIFKLIFGSERNIDILTDFLQSVIDIPAEEYEEISLTDPNLRLNRSGGKPVILDIKIRTKNGKIIDVEIQLLNVSCLRERIVYYTSKLITEQIGEGERYETIRKVITIVIMDFVLIKDSGQYHNIYRLHDAASGSEFTDIVEIHTLELPKVPRETDGTNLWDWLKFFKAGREEEYMVLTQKNPNIKKAVVILQELSEDERTRLEAEAREKAWKDEQGRLDFAYSEGIEEGIRQRNLEIVQEMRKRGTSDELIFQLTGIAPEQL